MRRRVAHPLLRVAARGHLLLGPHRLRMEQPVLGEFRIDVGVPIQHADDVVQVVMIFRRHVLHQKVPRHRPAFHHRLEHPEYIRIHLRLISDQRPRRMQDARVDLPSGARLQAIRFRMVQDAVVALVPALQASPHIVRRGARLQAHERVWKIVVLEVVLRREIVGFRLALLPDLPGMLFHLVHVVRNRSQVIEELAEHVPAAVPRHHFGAQDLVAQLRDGVAQQHALAVDRDIAEALVVRSARPIGGLRRR